jgi:hypothetical protein
MIVTRSTWIQVTPGDRGQSGRTKYQLVGDRLLRAAPWHVEGRWGWRWKWRLHGVLHTLSLLCSLARSLAHSQSPRLLSSYAAHLSPLSSVFLLDVTLGNKLDPLNRRAFRGKAVRPYPRRETSLSRSRYSLHTCVRSARVPAAYTYTYASMYIR